MPISGHKDKLLKATEIQDNVVSASALLDHYVKQALYQQSAFIRDFLTNNHKASSYHLRSLESMILTYWNESINPDTEKFWIEMKQNNIDFARKEPLRFALAKGWFRNVEQGIEARNHWKELKQLPVIINYYTRPEIEQLDKVIEEDERKRYGVLKKCLAKKAIAPTQYLKFGECMAYFGRCGLFEVYFSKAQVDELYTIWKNFEIQ